MVVGYHHFRKHPNPFWFALSSLCRLPISLWFCQTAFGVGDTVTPTNTSSKDKFLIFKEGEVKSLTEGCASGWLGMKSGMKHEAVEMYGVCQSISSQHVTKKKPATRILCVFVFQTEVESISLKLWYLANLKFPEVSWQNLAIYVQPLFWGKVTNVPVAPPKFNRLPLKNGGWNTILSYWEGNFSGANCSTLGGYLLRSHIIKPIDKASPNIST